MAIFLSYKWFAMFSFLVKTNDEASHGQYKVLASGFFQRLHPFSKKFLALFIFFTYFFVWRKDIL